MSFRYWLCKHEGVMEFFTFTSADKANEFEEMCDGYEWGKLIKIIKHNKEDSVKYLKDMESL
jgi:hypothetical protein